MFCIAEYSEVLNFLYSLIYFIAQYSQQLIVLYNLIFSTA